LNDLAQEVDLSEFFPDYKLNELLESFGKGEGFGSNEQQEENEEEIAELLDKVDEIESRVKLGEIWALGHHRLGCGDSTVEGNVRALLGDGKAVLVHADPPYGMGKEKDGVLNDNLYRDKLDDFQMKWIRACRGNVEDNGSFYIWGNAEDLWRLWYSGGLKNSERLTFRNQIIWDKKHGQGMGSDDFRMFPTVTEHCLFYMLGESNWGDDWWDGWKPIKDWMIEQKRACKWNCDDINKILGTATGGGGMAGHYFREGGEMKQWTLPTQEMYLKLQKAANGKAFKKEYDELKKEYDELKKEWYSTRAYFDNTHENMTDVWEYPRVQGEERWGHATPKPVDMIARIYKSSSPDDGVIYSPFLGSGTDIIAGEKSGGDRTVYGFELSPQYCEIILQRFSKLTGIEPKLIGRLPD
jgi:DNA modification methylase